MDNNLLINHIKKSVELTNKEELLLLEKVKIREYLKGQFVLQASDICRYDSFVLKGCLVTFCVDYKGKEHVLNFAIENWWTGDFGSFIEQSPAKYHIKCLENTTLAQISYNDYEDLFIRIPKLERFLRLLVQKVYVYSENRIIDNFMLSAKERYLSFCQKFPKLEQRIPQYLIASYLGITKEFLSKIRKENK